MARPAGGRRCLVFGDKLYSMDGASDAPRRGQQEKASHVAVATNRNRERRILRRCQARRVREQFLLPSLSLLVPMQNSVPASDQYNHHDPIHKQQGYGARQSEIQNQPPAGRSRYADHHRMVERFFRRRKNTVAMIHCSLENTHFACCADSLFAGLRDFDSRSAKCFYDCLVWLNPH